jgi:hypothetical protein
MTVGLSLVLFGLAVRCVCDACKAKNDRNCRADCSDSLGLVLHGMTPEVEMQLADQ